jgi:hypothetical protein
MIATPPGMFQAGSMLDTVETLITEFSSMEDPMYKLIAGLVAGTFAIVAVAQVPATTREKQEQVNAATKAGTRGASGSGVEMAKGSAAAAATANLPSPLPTTADKQLAVNAATKANVRGASVSGVTAAKGSAAAAADKGAPKPFKTTKEAQESVNAMTLQGAKDR